jgi:hypothetical protein
MARDFADPPDAPPELVWRSLLPLRPERPIPTRLRGVEGVPLRVRAVTGMAELLARDAAQGALEHARAGVAAREVLALVLHAPSGRAFPTAAAVGRLEQHELGALARETYAALGEICPTYARSNVKRWLEVLTEGARHPSNLDEASVLASCVDVTPAAVVPRPDRYWGGPLSQLLDGHWLAYRAARDALKDRK